MRRKSASGSGAKILSTAQRELNGLRVMMALMNNWDLKDVNNAIYEEKQKDDAAPELHYAVSDLGASFGTTGRSWTQSLFQRQSEILPALEIHPQNNSRVRGLQRAGAPRAHLRLSTPKEFISRMDMRWIGKHIPRSDARWIGGLLAQLSPEQIRDAFRAAGYSP